MDEQEFDALFQQPFGREDFQRAEAGLGRCGTLAAALFGRTPEDLCRQLVAFPSGNPFGLYLGGFPGPRTSRADDFRLGFKRFEQPTFGVAVSMVDAVRVGHHHG